MADGKRGIYGVHKELVVDWLEGKVDELHDRYVKIHRLSGQRVTFEFPILGCMIRTEKIKLPKNGRKLMRK